MAKLDEVIKGLDNMANGEKAFDEDNINHPKHYETDKVECIEAMEITQGRAAVMSFCLCNAFKYLWRHQRKNGVEDIKKARWYLDKYIELAEKEEVPVCKELKKVADENLSLKIKEAFGYVDPITEHLKPIWTDQMTDASKSKEPINFMDAPKELKDKWFMEMMKRASNDNPKAEDLEDLFRDTEYEQGYHAKAEKDYRYKGGRFA